MRGFRGRGREVAAVVGAARFLPREGSAYDDAIIRARLAQAFGRLIRSKDDRGHFVVLSSAFPSRLLGAFPRGTPVIRCSLDEALQRLGTGLSSAETPAAPAREKELR